MAKDPKQIQAKQAEVDRIFRDNVNNIVPVDIEKEMKKSFIDYAMSVITDRALPDVRDGLKPVHRRILYSMYSQGFTPDKPYRKCATTVGNVLGHFHPHGDAAVYEAMVRLAQDFSLRHPLVDGHGNFGSRDGDPPAAYRYTEARMTKIALEMMADINKNTVDFKPNFDEQDMEPIVLPARFPNLLVNGSTGIAVGMATNIPPHNLGEVIDATILRMKQPDCELDEVLECMPGPDFPTGACILGTNGIREAYKTGKGRIVVRATCEIEETTQGKQRIVVHDLPYMVNKARLIEKIAELAKEKRVDGIAMIRDESDRNEEVRIVIELKQKANAQVVLNQLYKSSQLQDAFSANLLALVPDAEGKFEPQTVTLLQCLDYYIDHQKEVVRRRVCFDLNKAEARKHILEGLRIAIANIDEVIRLIRASRTEEEAKRALMDRFTLSERQAQHIVDMRLGRLTGLEQSKLEQEYQDILSKIAYLESILREESLLIATIEEELLEVKRKFGDARRSQIEACLEEDITDESLIKEEQVIVTLTHFGYVKRLPVDTYQQQQRGGKGISGVKTREEDFVESLLSTSTHDVLLFFTNKGRVYRLKAYQIPEAGRQAKGLAIVNLLQLEAGEKVRNVLSVSTFAQEASLVFATRKGLVKRCPLAEFANINRKGKMAMPLYEGDELVGVRLAEKDNLVFLAKQEGRGVCFRLSSLREQSRAGHGVRGLKLREHQSLIGMEVLNGQEDLLLVSQNGFGKRLAVQQLREIGRGNLGYFVYKTSDVTGELALVATVGQERDVLLINDQGTIIRLDADQIPCLGRMARGVRLMRVGEGQVVDLAVVEQDKEAERRAVDEAEKAEALREDLLAEADDEADVEEMEVEGEEAKASKSEEAVE